jgi:DNA-binding IclR family transcriptional regulator
MKQAALTQKSIYKPLVPAVEQASRILLCLGEGDRFKMRLTDICRQVGIHKSKGHTILSTLIKFGLVEKDPHAKTYSLGPALIFLSRYVLENINYTDIVSPFLENLAKETNGTALFGLINGDHLFVIARREGNQNIGFSTRLGHRFHITLGAHGKAIVSFLPEIQREKMLARKKLHFYGDPSRMNIKRLRDDLKKCRELGFARDIGEVTPGVNGVSTPVFDLRNEIVGCIILMGTFPENMVEIFGSKIADMARQISYKLGADLKTLPINGGKGNNLEGAT